MGPVRNLVRAKEHGADKLVTLCSMCYNTLARANQIMQDDEVNRDTINRFMDEEIDYTGDVEVVHYLTFLQGGVELKGLSLDHVVKFEKELEAAGIENPAVAPILLPDYSTDAVAERRWPEALTKEIAAV